MRSYKEVEKLMYVELNFPKKGRIEARVKYEIDNKPKVNDSYKERYKVFLVILKYCF